VGETRISEAVHLRLMKPADRDAESVAVFGASGFVGRAVVAALEADGARVVRLSGPRLDADFGSDPTRVADEWIESHQADFSSLVAVLGRCLNVVNCAGAAVPTATESAQLWGANAVLPALIAIAARDAACRRFVHVSSAAVLGSQAILDERPPPAGHSPYARSKATGELAVGKIGGVDVVVYRPTSVLGAERPVAARLAQVLRSKYLFVPPGDPALPVVLVESVGRAVSFIVHAEAVPPVVLHPDEAMTVRSLAVAFGRTSPIRTMPRFIASPARAVMRRLAQGGPLVGHARRVELLWEGQLQRSSLPGLGFDPGDPSPGYVELGRTLRQAALADR
jgi:nucleoside-diphosphate-sugar epimerase